MTYLALLRGVNVGGKNMIPMAALRQALTDDGLSDVRTYIQSGNVIFTSDSEDTEALAELIRNSITAHFKADVGVVVFSRTGWERIIEAAPADWGKNPSWKHNLLVMLPPYDMNEVLAAVGELKPDIEALAAGDGVLYQQISLQLFGRATTGKLASNPIYKRMTIRNYNTSVKLLALMAE